MRGVVGAVAVSSRPLSHSFPWWLTGHAECSSCTVCWVCLLGLILLPKSFRHACGEALSYSVIVSLAWFRELSEIVAPTCIANQPGDVPDFFRIGLLAWCKRWWCRCHPPSFSPAMLALSSSLCVQKLFIHSFCGLPPLILMPGASLLSLILWSLGFLVSPSTAYGLGTVPKPDLGVLDSRTHLIPRHDARPVPGKLFWL